MASTGGTKSRPGPAPRKPGAAIMKNVQANKQKKFSNFYNSEHNKYFK